MKKLMQANPKVVKALMDHLISAFEDFYNEHAENGTEMDFIDGFMAAHNFHCVIVLDLEKRLKLQPRDQLFFRKLAADTFKQAMEDKAAWT